MIHTVKFETLKSIFILRAVACMLHVQQAIQYLF